MVTIDNLRFSYGKAAVLDNISLTLEDGRFYGLLGENGVGKTTLITLLCGLKKPEQGSIVIDGYDPYKRNVSFLQDLVYIPDEVPAYNQSATEFAKQAGKFRPGFNLALFNAIMAEFETDPSAYMNKMSAGQLKKTHISFALACKPKNLFMDEPTNGLDIPSKAQFRKSVMKYTREDAVVLISTHQVRDLENVIDPIVILDKREVLLNASLEEVASRLYFDYGTTLHPDALYSEQLPGGFIQVLLNTAGQDSKVNIEALFNAVHKHKELVKNLFTIDGRTE